MTAFLALAMLTSSGAGGIPEPTTATAAEDWQPLFNGRDLSGWVPKVNHFEVGENPHDTFRVHDGMLRISHDHYPKFFDQFAHLSTRIPYESYRLRLEYRFVGSDAPGGPPWASRNSGIMIYGQAPETIGRDQPFPISIEVQLLNGTADAPRSTGNICTPGTQVEIDGRRPAGHCVVSSSRPYSGEAWVTVELDVHSGRQTRVRIDGVEVASFDKPELDPTDLRAMPVYLARGARDVTLRGGHISLQGEGHPIDFRRIEILRLPE